MVLVGAARAEHAGAEPGRLIGRPAWRWCDTRRWGVRRVGLSAVMVVFAAIGGLNAFTVPPLVPPDEIGHISYVVSLTHGRLPTFDTALPQDISPGLRGDHTHRTLANHPPLFYLLAAGPMKLALSWHRPMLGIRLVRLMNVGFVMLTMALAAILARRFLGRSRRAPIVAAASTGLVATVPHFGAMAYNDAVAMFTATALIVAAVAVFDRGPTARRLGWVAAAASAAALARFSNLAVIAAAMVVVLLAAFRHTVGPLSRKAAVAGWSALVVGVPVVVSAGWFYLRNHHLYGDFSGAHELIAITGQRRQASAWSFLDSGRFWQSLHDDLWTGYSRVAGHGSYGQGGPLQVARVLSAVLGVGLVCAFVRWVGLRRRTGGGWPTWTPDLMLAVVAVAEIALFIVMTAQFRSAGGDGHGRYLFALLAVIGCVVALGWACLPGNRRGILSILAFGASVALAADLLHRLLVAAGGDRGWLGTEINALGHSVAAPATVLVVVLMTMGVALGIAAWALFVLPPEALLRNGEPEPEPVGAPWPPAVIPEAEVVRPRTVDPLMPLSWPG